MGGDFMGVPNNCTECAFFKCCESYYGGAGCEFEKVIKCLATDQTSRL